MRPICWLHISDIHMRVRDTWSQDVVLKAMCDAIAQQWKEGTSPDFILATGDLAFSGQADEYKLVGNFFDSVSAASGVPKGQIFCIPGNHDIDRERQKMCFLGVRNFVQSQNEIDLLLSPGEDFETLLKREENYRKFQNSYLAGQDREQTDHGLGYVSCLTIEDVRVAIVGMDSAWLAEGGVSDHGKLLMGERQVINAMDLAGRVDPHIIIGMAHHPLHLLQDFDRRPVQNRVERSCHFFHCGHLHEPEMRTAGLSASGCLTLAAGASFETRQSHNTYSVITVDLLGARRSVRTIQYHPSRSSFDFASSDEFPIEIAPSGTCSVGELAWAMTAYYGSLSRWANYFSALLLDQKSELPIPGEKGYVFGSYAVLLDQPDSELRRKTIAFIAFKNVLRVLYKGVSLADLFARYGDAVREYGAALEAACAAQPELKTRLADVEHDARAIASTEPQGSFSHTSALLAELAAAQEWDELRAQAKRHLGSPNPFVAVQAKRLLAVSLGNSMEAADKAAAMTLYQSLMGESSPEATDAGNLTTLLIGAERLDDAKRVVLDWIKKCPAKTAYFFEIGLKIVDTTGDREFRMQLEAAVEARGKSD